MIFKMLGRIVVYSITGCPHCLAAKALLKDNGLEYLDIGIDKFKPFVRYTLFLYKGIGIFS